MGPMQAPFAFSPSTLDRTAILLRCLAGDGDDLHAALGDLRHLEREQLLHQIRVGAADGHLGTAQAAGHADHVGLDSGSVGVLLPRHLLGLRQHRLDLADVDEYQAALRRLGVGLDDAGHDVALAAGVLTEGLVVLGVAQPLENDLPRGHRGDAAEVGRGVVVLLDDLAVGAEVLRPDDDLAGLAVDGHPRVGHGMRRVLVRRQQCGLEGGQQGLERDLLLAFDAAQRGEVDRNHVSPPPSRRHG
jgi:hypothetical protein